MQLYRVIPDYVAGVNGQVVSLSAALPDVLI